MRVYHTELDHLRRILFVCLIFESICETVTTLVNNNNSSQQQQHHHHQRQYQQNKSILQIFKWVHLHTCLLYINIHIHMYVCVSAMSIRTHDWISHSVWTILALPLQTLLYSYEEVEFLTSETYATVFDQNMVEPFKIGIKFTRLVPKEKNYAIILLTIISY